MAPTVQKYKCEPLIKVKHLENVGVLDLYRVGVIITIFIYLVTH